MPRQCTATSKRSRERCRRAATPGSPVCKIHGSGSPQAKRKAVLRLVEDEALAMVSRMDVAPVADPLLELRKLAGRALAWEAVFDQKRLEIQEWRYQAGAGEQLRSEIAVVERAMDRCAHVLGMIVKLGLDERLVRLEEAKAALVEKLILDVFTDLALTDDQIRVGRQSLGRRLAAITA